MASIEGQVLGVRPAEGGRYHVTVGPGPELYDVITSELVRVGTQVTIEGELLRRVPVERRGVSGGLTFVDGELRVVGPGSARVVSPIWMLAASKVFSSPLYRYQIEGGAWLGERLAQGKGAILADEQGLGKTFQALAAVVISRRLPVLVVCPSVVKKAWKETAERVRYPLTIQVLEGSQGAVVPAHLYVTNYELLAAREGQLGKMGLRAVIFDEAQMLKEPKPEARHRAAIATRIARRIGPVIAMTGTPILNRPAELWRLLHLVEPTKWASFEEYAARYCLATPVDEDDGTIRRIVTQHGRVERVDELKARVDPVMLRRTKAEVLKDLPPKSRRSLRVELDPRFQVHYDKAFQNLAAWYLAQGAVAAAGRAKQTEALLKLGVLRQLAALGKLRTGLTRYLTAWRDKTEKTPLVVFGYHRRAVAGIEMVARALGLSFSSLASTGEERDRAIESFQRGRVDLVIAPIRSSGVGINLQRASDALFLERTWVPGELLQAEDRVHRIGQQRPVLITYLDATGTIDEHLGRVLDSKHLLVSQFMDGESEESQRSMIHEFLSYTDKLFLTQKSA